jgi:multiple sugar transport system substrate-binding protein
MSTVQLIAVSHGEENDATLRDYIQRGYAGATSITTYDWETIWAELVNTGIYRRGADVSEIGSSWLESLIAMNALRPFSESEISALGGQGQFLPVVWQNMYLLDGKQVWGIPFRADVRVICYWSDLLETANVDPETAFASPEDLETALEQLQPVCQYPWTVSMDRQDNNTVYNAASWIWANGGSFFTEDGKKVTLDSPAAMEGLRQYFALRRFCQPGLTRADQTLNLFAQKKTAIMIAGPWIKTFLKSAGIPDGQARLVKVAPPPGPAYVGGSVLVQWQHSLNLTESLKLIHCLIQRDLQAIYPTQTGLLPIREDLWQQEPFLSDPHYQALYRILSNGRTLPSVPLWGMIERKLIDTLGQVWAELATNPGYSEKDVLERLVPPLIHKLNLTLAG